MQSFRAFLLGEGEFMKKKTQIQYMTDTEKRAYIARLNRQTRIISIAAIIFGVLAILIQLAMIIQAVWF